jgi:hypothetical protein
MIDHSSGEGETDGRGYRGERPLALHLTLNPGEALTGSIGRQGESGLHSFQGWLDLMALISRLRRQSRPTSPQ